MKFSKIAGVSQPASAGKAVALRGWVHRQRAGKDMVFIILRDSTGLIQCTVAKDKPFFAIADKLGIESSISIEGTLKKDERAPTGYEVSIEKLEVVGKSENFPITKDQSVEFLLDVRHLAVRSQKLTNVFKVRSAVFGAIHEFFRSQEFYETHVPILIPGGAEEGPTLFGLNYFGQKAYLAQTWQLYAETLLPSLEKIYTVIPAFRAEKTRTIRHLTEYWTAEAEAAWFRLDDMIAFTEQLISHVCQRVAKDCAPELIALGRDPRELTKIKPPFPRITYTEALGLLEKDGMKVPWGKDLRTEEERGLMKHFDKPLIITEYPKAAMAFYKPSSPVNANVALNYDILAPEIGIEIVGGSERDLDIEALKRSLKEKGEKIEDYEFYLDTRRYGSVPHSGFGLGIERVIMWLCKLDHIRDAIPFPRTMDRLKP